MWRTILCLLHVIYRSEPSTESLIVRFPCLLYLISYVFRWLQDTFAACMKERTCLYSKRPFSWQHIRTFVIIALVFVTFVWTPELSSFSTATNDDSFGSDSGGNGKNSVQLLPATDVSYSCTFDGDNWCGWMVSGEKGFTLRDHPPDPAAEAEKQKAAAQAASSPAPAGAQANTPSGSSSAGVLEDLPNQYIQNVGLARTCLATCFDAFYGFLESPTIISPRPDLQTCMSVSYRIGTGKRRRVDPLENPYSAYLALEMRDPLDTSETPTWKRFWNVSNHEQTGNDDWRASGKIYIPTQEETVIRFVATMYGGGTFISLDDIAFGCLGPIPIVPEIFAPSYIASCSIGWDDEWMVWCPLFIPVLLSIHHLTLFLTFGTMARREGKRLIHTNINTVQEEETINSHLRYQRTYKISFKRTVPGRQLDKVRFPACTPFIHSNPSTSPLHDSVTVNLSDLIAPATSQRTESHVRISLYQPMDSIAPVQRSVLTGETPESEGTIVNLGGRMFQRVAIHDCPLTLNSRKHTWHGADLPTFTFPTIKDALSARFVLYIGAAPWSVFTNTLLTEEATTVCIQLDEMKMKEIGGEWFLNDDFVFELSEQAKERLEAMKAPEERNLEQNKSRNGPRVREYEETLDDVTSINTWKAFVALSLSNTFDGAASFTFGKRKNSPVQCVMKLKGQQRSKTVMESILQQLHAKSTHKIQSLKIHGNRTMMLEIATNRAKTLLWQNTLADKKLRTATENEEQKPNAELSKVIELCLQVGYGHHVKVTAIEIIHDGHNHNFTCCSLLCHHTCGKWPRVRCRDCARCFLCSKIFLIILRLVTVILSFISALIMLILISIRDVCVAIGKTLRWLWRKSFILHKNKDVKDGLIPQGKIVAGRRFTIRHDFKKVDQKNRLLFVYQDGVAVQILSKARAVVKYDLGYKEIVEGSALRVEGSVPAELMRGSFDTRKTKTESKDEKQQA